MENRDEILSLSDEQLSACCDLEFFKGSGNGGQKRNKTSSAVRVRHRASGFCAVDCSGRSQHANRHAALRKLRLEIARNCRVSPARPPESMVCALSHEHYPLFCARLLDVLAEHDYRCRPAAAALGVTPSALNRLLRRDPALWQLVAPFYNQPQSGEEREV